MQNKDAALQQIDEIYNTLKGNLRTIISGTHMIVIGICIMAIPLIELIFNSTLDAYLSQKMAHPEVLIFLLRTIFYWTFFYNIGSRLKTPHKQNMLLEQAFSIGKLFPFIPISVAAALGITHNENLISPMVLILIGTLFTFFGQFTSRIVSTMAWSMIIAGIGGILLMPYAIPHLWIYLIMYQGLSFVIMGYLLRYEQNNHINE